MELTTLRLLFVGGLLVMGVAVVLGGLAMQRLADWIKSRGERAVTRRSNPRLRPRHPTSHMKRILVPLSGREPHEAIVPLVGTIARSSGATVRLLRVFPVPEVITRPPDVPGVPGRVVAYADQQMALLTRQGLDALRTVEDQLDSAPVEAVVRFGDPGQEILLEADAFGADLVAVAATNRSRLRRALFPGVAEQVARRTSTPVLMLQV
jgi:nucleotide-binding universal stress UspA family protein